MSDPNDFEWQITFQVRDKNAAAKRMKAWVFNFDASVRPDGLKDVWRIIMNELNRLTDRSSKR